MELFANEHHQTKVETKGDPLAEIESHNDFAALRGEVARVPPHPVSPHGGRPPHLTEKMVRIPILKGLYNRSAKQAGQHLLVPMSYKRFCGLVNATNIPDRATMWVVENHIGEVGAKILFESATAQFLRRGFIARGRQIIDATRVPAARQPNSRDESKLIKLQAMPAHREPAMRHQKNVDAAKTKKHSKSDYGYKLSSDAESSAR